jgi:pyruvate/2-oxoglutarate/acetoin dehydrogenase E1 component
MTSGEYMEAWANFMENDDPMIVSEHRESLQITEEMADVVHDEADITLYAISSPRFQVEEAAQILEGHGIICNIVHLYWLKPFVMEERILEPLRLSGKGLVIDAGYEICGASRSIAYELACVTGLPVQALGLGDNTKCLCPPFQNRAPDAEKIVTKVTGWLAGK